jgi:hypothetical protein
MQSGDTVIPHDGFLDELHLASTTTGALAVPLIADVTLLNVPGNKMYVTLTSSSNFSNPSVFSLPSLHYIIADQGYDAKKLYEYSKDIGNRFGLSGRKVQKYSQRKV